MNSIAEKYNGFLRCKLEKGEFVFRAALFSEKSGLVKKGERREKMTKRAVSSLLSVNIRTISDLVLGWGDNSISIESPELEGNGEDELNSAVKNCTDEAKEKFLRYFNRRYNGYVAEDMSYTVIRDDEKYFTAQFNVTVNAGGSMNYGRWIVFDKNERKVLELADLFKDGSVLETSDTLSELFDSMSGHKNFYMPHRSYIVNLDYSMGIKRYELLMVGNRFIPKKTSTRFYRTARIMKV